MNEIVLIVGAGPDEIAKAYIQLHNQDKSTWLWEIELRTSEEKF